jgi:VWFA-related protein
MERRRGRLAAWSSLVGAAALAVGLAPVPAGAADGGKAPPSPTPGAEGTQGASTGAVLDDRTPMFAAATRTVRVPVSVVDRNGRPVLGLRSQDFRVADDGRRQRVTLFSGERSALRIALALDVSRSMSNKIRQVAEALKHFTALLEPEDQILVITFGNSVQIAQDFTSDRALLAGVLDRLEPAGSTPLYDASAEAIRRVAAGPAESKAVVLVTDGVDTESATSFAALLELARLSEVPVFSIGLDSGKELPSELRSPPFGPRGRPPRLPGGDGRSGPGGGRWPGGGRGWPGGGGPGGVPLPIPPRSGSWNAPAGFDAEPLQELAEETGARAEIVKDLQHYTPGVDMPGGPQLRTAVESIATTLRHRYLLGYEPPVGKRGWRTIRVEVERDDATPRARKGYYAGG